MVVAAIGMQLVNNNVGSISLLVEKIGLQSFFAGYFAYLIGMILKKTTYMQFVKQHTLSCFFLSGGTSSIKFYRKDSIKCWTC